MCACVFYSDDLCLSLLFVHSLSVSFDFPFSALFASCMADIRKACQKRQEPLKNTQKSFSFQVIQSSRLLNWNKIKDCRFLPICCSLCHVEGDSALHIFLLVRFMGSVFFFFLLLPQLSPFVLFTFPSTRVYLALPSRIMFVLHLKT